MPYTARLIRVDLSTGTTSAEDVDPDVLRKWIGGTGLGVHYLMQEVPPGVEWDDPENMVFICTGPLGNTRVSGTGTISCVFKGPMNNLAGATQANGYLGAFLRSQGYLAIVDPGQGGRPEPAAHRRERRQIPDATKYAGLAVWQLEDTIRAEEGLNEKQLSAFRDRAGRRAPGPVRGAGRRSRPRRLAQRRRRGAGRQELKAITCKRGKVRPSIADNGKLNELVKPLFQDAKEFGGGSLYNWGTAGGVSGAARGGWLPIKNYTTSIFEEHEKISGQYLRGNFEWKTNPCWACQMGCCKLMTVTEGPYAGYSGEEPEYEGHGLDGVPDRRDRGRRRDDAGERVRLARVRRQRARLAARLGDRVLRARPAHQEQLDGLEPRWGDPRRRWR